MTQAETNTDKPLSHYHKWKLNHPESFRRYVDRKLKQYKEDPEYQQLSKARARISREKHITEDPDYVRNYHREHRAKLLHRNPILFMLKRKKMVAARNGIEFDLEENDLTLPETCPVLGIPLLPYAKVWHPNKPSIDRIDPQKGYIKGNVMVISWLANRLKSNCANPQYFRAIADYLERHLPVDNAVSGDGESPTNHAVLLDITG